MKLAGYFAKFMSVGAFCTLLDFALFATLVAAGLGAATSNIISYTTGGCASFLLNRGWAFRRDRPDAGASIEFTKFCLVNAGAIALTTALVALGSRWTSPAIAKLLSLPANLAWNFTFYKLWVFRSRLRC